MMASDFTNPMQMVAESIDLVRAGKIGAGLKRAAEAEIAARASGNAAWVSEALTQQAAVHFRLGSYERALELARRALEYSEAESIYRINTLMTLGNCAAEMGDLIAAEEHYQQAVRLSRQLGDPRALRRGLHNLSANVYVPRGQFELALAADEESLRLALELDPSENAWYPLATMGWIYVTVNRQDDARRIAQQLKQNVEPGSLGEGFYLALCGDLALEYGRLQEARELYFRARSIAEMIGDPGLNVLLRLGLSRCSRIVGDLPAARDWAMDALDQARSVGHVHLQGMSLIEAGLAFQSMQELERASSSFLDAIGLLEPLGANYDLARACFFLAAQRIQDRHPEGEATWALALARVMQGGYEFLLERERSLAFPLLSEMAASSDAEHARLAAELTGLLLKTPPHPLEIRGLGRFEVRHQGRLISDAAWRKRKAGELFRYLLLCPQYCSGREQAAEALWPDKSPQSIQNLFHRATSALRRALEPDLPEHFPSRYLEVEAGKLILHLPSGSQVDFEAFQRAVQREDWGRAAVLYEGDLFPDDLFSEWSAAQRERLKLSAIRAQVELAQSFYKNGELERAIQACHAALELEPWQEQAVLIGMRAYHIQGDRMGAIKLYRDLADRLRADLDIEPQADVREFYRSLL